jgi:hypothetical protein
MRFMSNLLGYSENIREGLTILPAVLQYSCFPCQWFSVNVQDLFMHLQEVFTPSATFHGEKIKMGRRHIFKPRSFLKISEKVWHETHQNLKVIKGASLICENQKHLPFRPIQA